MAQLPSMYPSLSDFATASMPTLPLAPGRFSTTIVWPSSLPASSASRREIMSELPPGAVGTISRIGRVG